MTASADVTSEVAFDAPPRVLDETGQARTVGLEIEYQGLSPQQSCDVVQSLYGGRVVPAGINRLIVEGTSIGDFVVERDSDWLRKHDEHRAALAAQGGLAEVAARAEGLMMEVVEKLVPIEIGCPPVPYTRLLDLERLRQGLQAAGAKGNDDSVFYAFGFQINARVADTGVDHLLGCLRVFVMLQSWLAERGGLDLSRRVAAFVAPFGSDYVRLICDPGYKPDWGAFVDDYIHHNPTRNRGLDMLPVFAWVDEARVRAQLPDPRIKRRPTFHYRLPSCRIDHPNWTFAGDWNRWVLLERIAQDEFARTTLQAAFLRHMTEHPHAREATWTNWVGGWVEGYCARRL